MNIVRYRYHNYKWGHPQIIHLQGIFLYKPSSYGGIPILGNPQFASFEGMNVHRSRGVSELPPGQLSSLALSAATLQHEMPIFWQQADCGVAIFSSGEN